MDTASTGIILEVDALGDVLQFGPFMVRTDWFVLAVSGIAGYAVMVWKWKRSDVRDHPVLEPLINALLIVIMVWKISPILFSPSLLGENPLIWLMLPGTSAGWWLGLAVAAVYAYRSWRKINAPLPFVGDLLSLGAVAMIAVHSLLGWQYGSITTVPWGISINNPEFNYHPVNVYRLLVALPMLLWMWRSGRLLGTGKWLSNTLTYFGIGMMVLTFFKTKTGLGLGFSGEQLVLLLCMLLGLGLTVFINRRSLHV